MDQDQKIKRLQRMRDRDVRQALMRSDHGDFFPDLPEDMYTDYPIEMERQTGRQIQKKYMTRAVNIKRCWNRINLYFPETLTRDRQLDILEMSTAHGAMLEIWRHFGHNVMGNDYANFVSQRHAGGRALFRDVNDTSFARKIDDYGIEIPEEGPLTDWPYREIIESINIPMRLFDAGHTPYPFEDKSFDVIACMQAIEHYCHPRDWKTIVDELCRLSRESVFILLNPILPNFEQDPDYAAAFDAAIEMMRLYDDNGFRCVSTHIYKGKPLGFKLMAV